jgi:hypothetical protein
LKKSKGKEKVLELNEKPMHMDLHSLKESKDVDSLLVIPLNESRWEKRANRPLEHLKVDKAFGT